MKKLFALILAIALVAALALPALAENDEPIFDTQFNLVDNEPTVEYDEWDVPYNVWNPISANTKLTVGETVTLTLTYTVPETVEGYEQEMLSSIEYIVTVNGVDGLTVLEAYGCPGNQNCDYELGVCMPGEGYSNINVEGNTCTVMAELNSDVTVVLRGTVAAEAITAATEISIGQYHFPAYFSLGVVEKGEANGFPTYNAHRSDFFLVQKRSVEFRADEMGVYSVYAALNNHYHRVITDGVMITFIPVDDNFEDNGDFIDTDTDLFATLTSIFVEYMDLFGFDYTQTSFTDESFLGDGAHDTFTYEFELGGNGAPVETEAPVETGTPVETEAPADPSNPEVPDTGAISFVGLGIASIIGGAVIASRRRK